ncbi:MAG: RNA ligase family protein [Sandaracinaceae bacterium]
MGVVDEPAGTDLSEGRCQPERAFGKGRVLKWSSIELLHNIKAHVVAQAALEGQSPPTVTYRAKVKLHGTNAAVQVHPDGTVVAQGRNHVLTEASDNLGFAAWVMANYDAFAAVARSGEPLIFYGEWCGPGIQRGVSVTRLDRKVFAVFAAQLGDHHETEATLLIEPDAIAARVPEHPDVFVLPWYAEPIDVPFDAPETAADTLNRLVAEVEQNDPWVQEVFGIAGTGEGIVLYPQIDSSARGAITALLFKAKGEKHRVRKAKQAVEVDPEVARSVEAFVATFATEGRFAQGVSEVCAGPPAMKDMGAFLRWVGQDVRKESADDLAAAGLEWKQINKAVTAVAKQWFIAAYR